MSIYTVNLSEQSMLDFFGNNDSDDLDFLSSIESETRDRIIELQDIMTEGNYQHPIPYITTNEQSTDEIETKIKNKIIDYYDISILAENLIDKISY